jgi:hypothetical protein
VAIILRGPPCGGKTTVSRELLRRAPSSQFVSLDDGWGAGEARFLRSDAYRDLKASVDTLVVELGFGEPAGESFAGATRDPASWLAVLADDDRSTYMFLLKPSLEELRRRIVRDRDPRLVAYFVDAALKYETGGLCSYDAFSSRLPAGTAETLIDTSLEPMTRVVDRIMATALAE